MKDKSFVTALNCIDGRVQEPVIRFLRERYKIDFVDMITEPGMDKILAKGEKSFLNELKNKIEISIKKHHSRLIAIVGHADCAANPAKDKEHFSQIKKGKEIIKSMCFNVEILGLWVNEKWDVKVLE
jgi:hypothetical protein